ncbi:hypothetical protein GBAR_LOCUS21833, partial [Geodia barretti]
MTDTHAYKQKVPGYSPSGNRYYVRLHAPEGSAAIESWHAQKAKVPGYTQPSNQYFATRQRLAWHQPTKRFTAYGMKIQGVSETAKAQTQQAPPPPPEASAPPPQPTQKGSKQSELEAYEAEYLKKLELAKQQRAKARQQQAEPKPAAKPKAGALPKRTKPAEPPKPAAPKQSSGKLPK